MEVIRITFMLLGLLYLGITSNHSSFDDSGFEIPIQKIGDEADDPVDPDEGS